MSTVIPVGAIEVIESPVAPPRCSALHHWVREKSGVRRQLQCSIAGVAILRCDCLPLPTGEGNGLICETLTSYYENAMLDPTDTCSHCDRVLTACWSITRL